MPNDNKKTDLNPPTGSPPTAFPAVPNNQASAQNSPTQPDPALPSSNLNVSMSPQSGVLETAYPPANETPETIVTSPQTPKKYGGKKIIATIFGITILMAGVAAAVFLVQRQQEIEQRASSGAACTHSPDCVLLESPGNSGTYTAPRTITHLFITAQEAHEFKPQNLDNGCYRVSINGPSLQWQRYGDGPSCKDISNIQVWLGDFQPTPTTVVVPAISASCGGVKAYNLTWNQLTTEELKTLKTGEKVRFAVSGTTNSGSFDKAKFSVNGTETESTTLRPGTNEYYIEYQVPSGVTSFTVNAQVHHTSLGWF